MKKLSFRGGIHPLAKRHEGKAETSGKPIRDFVAECVCIPMDMHMGPPCKPCVQQGEHVKLGQVIGEAVGRFGIPAHASVSGVVTAVGPVQQLRAQPSLCVTIRNDFKDELAALEALGDVESAPKHRIIPAIQAAGICGMGGAGFPTHAKLRLPEGKAVDTIILNGAECETFLTCDHRLMLESPGRIVDGLRAVMRAMGVARGVIAIEDNKPDAIESMRRAAQGRDGVEVAVLKTKYPQGGEKQLVTAVTGREVPGGGLPMDARAVVINVGTAAAIADTVIEGKPLISRVTTVTGAVKDPSNLRLRVGTAFADAIKSAGGYREAPGKIFAGGSMTGTCAPDDSVSATKGTNGIVTLTEREADAAREIQCIRCGRCVMICPARIMPYRLMELYERGELNTAKQEHVKDCIQCGSCSYVCPSKRRLLPSIKSAIEQLARRRNR
ncbi:MAG: electron transport complex subunit RsxC [Firmicutes bacterium]|nr:electron transport complex subunit RsxC [Bacillota bacterium]